mmetsp:Transcript_8689/g.12825  ORF Transcript_8689/g.12825 Transcript_8689/m.12825 type:complete len:481 (+) Transcript_8689:110-1552(+)|eukprot:CAMPEP_0196808434 /NCGR_PEP_ID=MMETSP1362-20130617/8416_1 /TAXON_ID=163516 /ORGANISM="Leptocylindrus danicus, Strain CCMP1856" /LENGTH=480 /DNA_ID=CAMNT_0042182775 /DNA_START=71 /DNA_END=1513 /DNA_ORIENTATION=-
MGQSSPMQRRKGASKQVSRSIYSTSFVRGVFLLTLGCVVLLWTWTIWSSDIFGEELEDEKVLLEQITDNVKSGMETQNEAAEHADHDQQQQTPEVKAIVAYMISLTHCKSIKFSENTHLTDGAVVLKHSIHLNSIENYAESKSLYGYKMYAIVHPIAESCSKVLKDAGYEILIRETPINVDDIKGDFLREKVVTNGCCGEKEYNKLWAYTMKDHPIAVHLDLDTLVLQPMDDLFDAMLDGNDSPARSRVPVMHDKELPDGDQIQAYFTRDYNMIQPKKKVVGVQGGFIVLRPSEEAFKEYQDIIIEGKFFSGSGWGGLGFGGFFGGMTFQGLVPYFYDHQHPGTGVELNRCIYNSMADNPRMPAHADKDANKCRDGHEECEDCRETDISKIKTVHFTICQKPWNCKPFAKGSLCNDFHHKWFQVRKSLDDRWAEITGDESLIKKRNGSYYPDHFMGYCNHAGTRGYIPAVVPECVENECK